MVDGLVVVDKPDGWTSHDVVARCRRVFGQKRVGHAGTLDPGATGVLLVGLGRVTRLLRFLAELPKTYVGEVVLGTETTTLDDAGEVTAIHEMAGVGLDAVRAAAAGLTGDLDQVPPMVSAVKVGGRRLHALARAGIEVERAPRRVVVRRFDVDSTPTPGVYRIGVECSSGTYVRVLAADLGAALGGGAHLRNLRRTAVGPFGVDHARALDELGPDAVLPPAAAVAHLPTAVVDDAAAGLVRHGRPLPRDQLAVAGDGPWAVLDGAGRLLAVYEAGAGDNGRPAVVLAQ